VIGLVDATKLKPGDLVGVNKDSYLILDTLPPEYDARVKAMELDTKPKEDYTDIGGLDKQIEELTEAIVLPMTHKDRFDRLGIKPPKGTPARPRCSAPRGCIMRVPERIPCVAAAAAAAAMAVQACCCTARPGRARR
jgi:hypothetical protein